MKKINLNRDIESRAEIASRIYANPKPSVQKDIIAEEKVEKPKSKKDVLEVSKNKNK